MSDIICTNCRGTSTVGCELCNPSFVPLNDCREKDQRIAELEALLKKEGGDELEALLKRGET